MKEMRRHRGCLRIVMGCAAASAAGLGLEAHRAEEGGGVGAAYLVVVEQLRQLAGTYFNVPEDSSAVSMAESSLVRVRWQFFLL